MSRTCKHFGEPLPADTGGRGGVQPRRKFCTEKCKNDHKNAARRMPRSVLCARCGRARVLITPGVAGDMCRACAALIGTRVAQQVNARPTIERFLDLVERGSEGACWKWTGHRQPNGYGAFRVDGKTLRAHRWSYEHYVGLIPAGMQIDHLCRVRHCVNPGHLEPVTAKENTRRAREASNVAQ